jgi:hypothetical protein
MHDNYARLKSRGLNKIVHKKLMIHIFESLDYIKGLKKVSPEEIKAKKISLPFTKPGISNILS